MSSQSRIPWFDDFVGVAYRYYDLRMNVVPLITDRIRSKLSSESVEDRIRKMYLQLEKSAK